MRWLLCLLTALLPASPSAQVAERLTLYVDVRPPLVTLNDGQLGGSLGRRAADALKRTGIPVDLVTANVARQDHEIAQNQKAACALGRLHSADRARLGQFSQALSVTTAYVALTRLGQRYPQPATLQAWAADETLAWGLQRGLHYSDHVQSLLREARARTIYIAQSNQHLTQMLAAGRLDFMLVHEEEGRELLQSLPPGHPVRLVALQDLQTPEHRYFYCSKRVSPDLMRRLNDAIQAPSSQGKP